MRFSRLRRAASYARNVPSANDIVARQLAACEQIGMYLVDMQLMTDTHMEQIVAGTVGRARETFRAMCFLASEGQSVQAAMLCRSIFEDMVVAHWLVLHEDDPEFLTQRYMRQLDAIRLNEAKTTEAFGWVPDDVSDLAGREEELRKEFGNHAQWHWWAVRREGQRLTLSEVITELESSPRFQPRLQGETPVLRHMYEKAQKWNNQLLHHTPAGMPVWLNPEEPLKVIAAPTPSVPAVVFPAYWSYGQLVYLVLEVVPNQDYREFEEVFLKGLADGFGAPIEFGPDGSPVSGVSPWPPAAE
jgi:hypothetical protein